MAGAGGLSEREAAERLLRFGPNELPRRHEPSIARRIAHQAAEPLTLVLLAAAVVSAFVLDQPLEGMAIAAIVVLNVAIGTFEERRAAAAVAALEALAAPTARVRRAGVVRTVPAADLVPGDVVEVAAGDRVPADIVVDDAWLLAADEALLTGESFPANKTATDHRAADGVPLGDRHGELFAERRSSGVAPWVRSSPPVRGRCSGRSRAPSASTSHRHHSWESCAVLRHA